MNVKFGNILRFKKECSLWFKNFNLKKSSNFINFKKIRPILKFERKRLSSK